MEENNYINEQLLQKIGQEQNVKANQIKAVLKLIEEGDVYKRQAFDVKVNIEDKSDGKSKSK